MKPNWFVALRCPEIPGLAEAVARPPEGVRLFAPGDLHVTVAFLGGVGEEAARRAWAMRGQADLAAIPASLGAVVPMGPPRRFSALAAELEEGREAACALIEGLRAPMLEAAGASPDTRPPRPHLTLARVRRRAPAPERRAAIAWASGLVLPAALLRFEELVLYTWAEDRQRGLFRGVASERLG